MQIGREDISVLKSSGQFLHFSGMFICVKAIIIAMNIINSVAANTEIGRASCRERV